MTPRSRNAGDDSNEALLIDSESNGASIRFPMENVVRFAADSAARRVKRRPSAEAAESVAGWRFVQTQH